MRQGPHGGEIYAFARSSGTDPARILDYSSNPNIFARDLTAELVARTPYPFEHYPDSSCADLREALARHENMPPAGILPGNGAAELIRVFLHTVAPRRVILLGPVFSEYVAACRALGIPYDIVAPKAENDFEPSAQDMRALGESGADLAILCCPNNPGAATYVDLPAILHGIGAPRILLDCSYREFLYGSPAYAASTHAGLTNVLRPGASLLTLHSFTKFFCCPGIRLGYIMGDHRLLERMDALRAPWTVDPFSQLMGRLFLEHIEDYRATLPALADAIAHLGRELRLSGLFDPDRVLEGPGFVTARLLPPLRVEAVYLALQKRRILVRCCDPIPGMPPGFLRIQARPEADTILLLAKLAEAACELGASPPKPRRRE